MGKTKFQAGDLVSLNKDVTLHRFPDVFFTDESDAGIRNAIIANTSVRYTISSSEYGRENGCLKAGTVGIVKGYENVFMFDYEYFPKGSLFRAHWKDGIKKHQDLSKKEIDQLIWSGTKHDRAGYLNKQTTKLLVLFDGMMVACDSIRYIESAAVTQERYASVDFVYTLDFCYKGDGGIGPSEAEVQQKILTMTKKYRKSPDRLVYTLRDGSKKVVEMK